MRMSRLGVLPALVLCVGLASCAGGGSTAGGPAGKSGVPSFARNFEPPASGCGSYSAPMPADPEGALASLDAEHRKAYAGYFNYPQANGQILKSAWADWKPSHDPPYDVAIVFGPLTTDWQVQITNAL